MRIVHCIFFSNVVSRVCGLQLHQPKYGDSEADYQEGTEAITKKNAMNDCAEGLKVSPGTKDVSKSQATRILTSKIDAIITAGAGSEVESAALAKKETEFNFKKRHAAQDCETNPDASVKSKSIKKGTKPPFGATPQMRKNWSGPNSPSDQAEKKSQAVMEKGKKIHP